MSINECITGIVEDQYRHYILLYPYPYHFPLYTIIAFILLIKAFSWIVFETTDNIFQFISSNFANSLVKSSPSSSSSPSWGSKWKFLSRGVLSAVSAKLIRSSRSNWINVEYASSRAASYRSGMWWRRDLLVALISWNRSGPTVSTTRYRLLFGASRATMWWMRPRVNNLGLRTRFVLEMIRRRQCWSRFMIEYFRWLWKDAWHCKCSKRKKPSSGNHQLSRNWGKEPHPSVNKKRWSNDRNDRQLIGKLSGVVRKRNNEDLYVYWGPTGTWAILHPYSRNNRECAYM